MIEKLQEIMDQLKNELYKVERGNQSAGIRARKLLQDIRLEAKNIRVQIQEIRNQEKY